MRDGRSAGGGSAEHAADHLAHEYAAGGGPGEERGGGRGQVDAFEEHADADQHGRAGRAAEGVQDCASVAVDLAVQNLRAGSGGIEVRVQ